MAILADISGFTAGDDFEVDVTVPGIPTGQSVTKAWLTAKIHETDPDLLAVVQKVITAANLVGTGQITNDGSVGGTATLRFDLTPTDTVALLPPSAVWPQDYFYDVQIHTSAGKTYTSTYGTIVANPQVTLATS